MLKVSASYLEKQKSFIPKRIIFLAVVNIKTKRALFTDFSGKILDCSMYVAPLSSTIYKPPFHASIAIKARCSLMV